MDMLALFFFGLVHPGFVVCGMSSDICSLSSNKKLPRLKIFVNWHSKSSSHFTVADHRSRYNAGIKKEWLLLVSWSNFLCAWVKRIRINKIIRYWRQ